MSDPHSHITVPVTGQGDTDRAFILGITLNLIFVAVEFTAGLWINSMALISDAGHNLSDVASLALAMVAFRLAKKPPTGKFTYGFRKSTILISWLNAMILLVVVGAIAWESLNRLNHRQEIPGDTMAIVAGIGIVINLLTAMLFFRNRKRDLNIKGAFLHMAADALVSAGVVAGGIVIGYTHWYWVDTVLSLAIVVVINVSTWGLLRDSTVLALDGVPPGIDPEAIRAGMCTFSGVTDIHHIHVWAMSTTENAMTAHVVLDSHIGIEESVRIKERMKEKLREYSIGHATLEMELNNNECCDQKD